MPRTSSAPARSANSDNTPAPQPRSTTRQRPAKLRVRATASDIPEANALFLGESFIISEYQSRRCARASGVVAKRDVSATSNQRRKAFHSQWTATSSPPMRVLSRAGSACTLSMVQDGNVSHPEHTVPNSISHCTSNASGRPARNAESFRKALPSNESPAAGSSLLKTAARSSRTMGAAPDTVDGRTAAAPGLHEACGRGTSPPYASAKDSRLASTPAALDRRTSARAADRENTAGKTVGNLRTPTPPAVALRSAAATQRNC
mmetsp:Transcript_8967/g.27883  ORF Transcript_8967/g.27883 Transcript_8967/m.27883 type:complete len:262 (-) Transcript_8967:925-1710(-)